MEERRKKRIDRGSVLDVFLVLLLLGSLATAALRFYRLGAVVEDSRRAEVVLLSRGIRGEIGDQVSVGEELYSQDGSLYGKITDIRIQGSRIEILEEGEVSVGEWDPALRCDAFLTVEIWGGERDGIFYRDGREAVLVGDQSVLHTRRATLTPVVAKVLVSE